MAKYTDAIRDVIISSFNAGDQPTEAQFTNWITRIQEGIEEHDHDGTGDGDGIGVLALKATAVNTFPLTITNSADADPSFLFQEDAGGDALLFLRTAANANKVLLNTSGDSYFLGGNVGIGIAAPGADLQVGTVRPILVDGTAGNIKIKGGVGGWALQYGFQGSAGTDRGGLFAFGNTDALTYWNIGAAFDDGIFTILAGGNVGIGIAAPLGKLHIDQSVNDAAIPVLILDQADISEGTINFIASARGVITGATNSTQSVRVELGGVVYRLALYVDA